MQRNALVLVLSVLLGIVNARSAEIGIESRIINGDPSTIQNDPYVVSVRLWSQRSATNKGHTCGGIIITNGSILTAAHCVFDSRFRRRTPSELYIMAGQSTLQYREDSSRELNVKRIIVHPDFVPGNVEFDNDIAILWTHETIPLHVDGIKTIKLPSTPPVENPSCKIVGWGKPDVSLSQLSNELMAAFVPLHSMETCNSRSIWDGEVKTGMICAGELDGSKDSCQGDSGGPLQCDGVLYGIVSHGHVCGTRNKPGIYTDVYHFLEWIRKNDSVSLRFSSIVVIFSLILTLSGWII